MQLSKIAFLFRRILNSTPRFKFSHPWDVFHTNSYLEHTSRRLEHLASLKLDFDGKSVLEFGSGVGDLTSYFVARSCRVTATDSRPELVRLLKKRFKNIRTSLFDLEYDSSSRLEPHQVVFSYGVLYHISSPSKAISLMSSLAIELLVLETCVSPNGEIDNTVPENSLSFSQATSGLGSRPNREQLFLELKRHFEFVYLPISQPRHPEFPLDWSLNLPTLSRAIFICSRVPIHNPGLTTDFLQKHESQK